MGKVNVELAIPTPPQWLDTVLANFDAFLADHANCERKASALAMGMIVKYPDREAILPGLVSVAREELEHFDAVYTLMRERSVALVRDRPDPYVNELMNHMRHGRDDRLLDRLVVASLVETRGAERFGLVARNITCPRLAEFYARLYKSEVKHGHVFMRFALTCFDADAVADRAREFTAVESKIMAGMDVRPALH
jgi:tRNA 2-(methylsulfanyl)-N6-isopentenyladenosine37 hydroxylase